MVPTIPTCPGCVFAFIGANYNQDDKFKRIAGTEGANATNSKLLEYTEDYREVEFPGGAYITQVFLGYVLDSEKNIKRSFECTTETENNTPICVEGYDKTKNSSNIDSITEFFGTNSCYEMSGVGYICDNYITYALTDSDGFVRAGQGRMWENQHSECYVNSDGSSYCMSYGTSF